MERLARGRADDGERTAARQGVAARKVADVVADCAGAREPRLVDGWSRQIARRRHSTEYDEGRKTDERTQHGVGEPISLIMITLCYASLRAVARGSRE